MLCRCARCLEEKAPSDFYANDRTCKECRKAAIRANRMEKIEYYRSFDKMRASLPHRVAARLQYAKTEQGQAARIKARNKWDVANARKKRTHALVWKALRTGKIERLPCFICGNEAQAHHPDYDRPLDVVWLCTTHHAQAHILGRELMEA